jgi:uncharacterized Tic20 family protein
MNFRKKHLIPVLAGIAFIIGIISLLLPFLPIGWLMIGISLFILLPYLSPLRKLFIWASKKDDTKVVSRAGQKVVELYAWAHEYQKAAEVKRTVDNNQKR